MAIAESLRPRWADNRLLSPVPINVFAAQLVKIDKLPVQFQLGGRYYAEGPSGGPEWGLRFAITFLFPK